MAMGAIKEVPVIVPTEKAYTDVLLTCRDCGEQFTWTAGEQEFYHEQGLKNPPARCGPCRIARKEAQDTNPRRPPAFGSGGGNRPGGGYRSGFGGGNGGNQEHRGAPMSASANTGTPGNGGGGARPFSGGGYASRPVKVLFDTVCAECGQATQVPFQPRGDRPVYCRSCFDRRRAAGQY